jgi:hypothetical protein
MKMPATLTPETAEKSGYVSMTTSYQVNSKIPEVRDQHRWMLSRVLMDMRGCNVVLVDTSQGPEVWRHVSEINLDENGVRRGGPGQKTYVPNLKRGIPPKSAKREGEQ